MDLTLAPDKPASLEAPAYALLLAAISCWQCKAKTSTAAIWIPSYVERDEDGDQYAGDGPAVLKYVEGLSPDCVEHVQRVAPWLRPAPTRTSGIEYLAHHCASCDAVQGDHYVFGVDGPYFPQDEAAIASLQVVPGVGALRAVATAAGSGWMERVAVSTS